MTHTHIADVFIKTSHHLSIGDTPFRIDWQNHI